LDGSFVKLYLFSHKKSFILNEGPVAFFESPKLLKFSLAYCKCLFNASKCEDQSLVKAEALSFRRTGGDSIVQEGLKP